MTITVRLDEALEDELRNRLAGTKMRISDFVRHAIAEKLARETQKPNAYEIGKHLFGRYKSGRSDLSTAHERMLKERFSGRHRR